MAREVLKWRVPVNDRSHALELPHGARILASSAQTPYAVEFWTESLRGDEHVDRRTFRVFGTGQSIPPGYNHVSTSLYDNGQLVWHLYEQSGFDRRYPIVEKQP